jgi:hypothetical protein
LIRVSAVPPVTFDPDTGQKCRIRICPVNKPRGLSIFQV